MEVRIRLQKAGKSASKRYNYRIVVLSRTDSRQARNMDILGHYDPAKKPAVIKINQDKLKKWVAQGAQMSETVRSLLKKTQKAA